MPVGFARANLRKIGRPFECEGCQRLLIIPKIGVGRAVAYFAVLFLLERNLGLIAVIIALVGISLWEWLRVRVSLAPKDEH